MVRFHFCFHLPLLNRRANELSSGYKTHHDRIPMGEVLAALTPEDGIDISTVEKSPHAEESSQSASDSADDQGQSSTDSAADSSSGAEVSVDTESEK